MVDHAPVVEPDLERFGIAPAMLQLFRGEVGVPASVPLCHNCARHASLALEGFGDRLAAQEVEQLDEGFWGARMLLAKVLLYAVMGQPGHRWWHSRMEKDGGEEGMLEMSGQTQGRLDLGELRKGEDIALLDLACSMIDKPRTRYACLAMRPLIISPSLACLEYLRELELGP